MPWGCSGIPYREIPAGGSYDPEEFWGRILDYSVNAELLRALDAVCALGIGIEAVLLEHFSFPFEFGYTGTFPDNPRVTFSVAGGLRYRY